MTHFADISLNPTGEIPLYEQIALHFAERIRRRALPKGHRLPPTRVLAHDLKTHRNTVVRAFAILQSSGMVESVVGRGTFVTYDPSSRRSASLAGESTEDVPREGLPWGALLSRAANTPSLDRTDRLTRMNSTRDTINLQSMQPSSDLLPVESFQRCAHHVLRTVGAKALGYGPREGLPRLREAVVSELVERCIGASVDDVLITSGSQQALDLVARALVNPGEPFLVEEPTYAGAINVLGAQGASLMGVRHDDEGPDIGALERLSAARPKGLYLMPGGRNPTGSWITAHRRDAILAWSRRACIPIIEDDYVADLVWEEGSRPLPLRALDGDVIYFGSFSKNLIPSLRIGFVVCPPGLRPHLVQLKHAMDLGSSLFLQHTLAEFLERGELRAHLRKTRPVYRARLDALEAALRQHVPTDVIWHRPKSGFSVWLALPPALDPEAVAAEARQHGVGVTAGTLCSVDNRSQAGVRLTFSGEPAKRIVEGVVRLGAAIRAVRARAKTSGSPSNSTTSGLV